MTKQLSDEELGLTLFNAARKSVGGSLEWEDADKEDWITVATNFKAAVLAEQKPVIDELKEQNEILLNQADAACSNMAAYYQEIKALKLSVKPNIDTERKQAEYEYSVTAFNYPEAPIGSRDWCLYWAGWLARSTAEFDPAPAPSAPQAEAVPVAWRLCSDTIVVQDINQLFAPQQMWMAGTVVFTRADHQATIDRLTRELAECQKDAGRWKDVAEELPQEAQEVLFVRDGKTVHGAWIGGIFWHSNQKMAAAKWMPLPVPPDTAIDAAMEAKHD